MHLYSKIPGVEQRRGEKCIGNKLKEQFNPSLINNEDSLAFHPKTTVKNQA